jgi:ABC-type amino acid transport substrate-binding protein
VVRKGAGFSFAEWSDLKGREGVTNIGESYGDKFDAFMAKELTVARAAGVDKAFAALLAQQADYMIIGLFPGREEARKLGLIGRSEFLPKELISAAMYVASPSNPNAARCKLDSRPASGRRSMAALCGNCWKRLTRAWGNRGHKPCHNKR